MYHSEEKKELTIYILVAYGITFAMGLLMWYGAARGTDVSAFPNAQMMYPAAGVMLAYLLTRGRDENLPKGFYITFLILTGLMLVMAVVSVFVPVEMEMLKDLGITFWTLVIQYVMLLGSIVAWIVLLATKKWKREAYGLRFCNGKASVFCVVLFFVLYTVRSALSCVLAGQTGDFLALFSNPATWMGLAVLPVNFFLVFVAFFGEEYGWRYYLQPLMQEKFGLRGGVILLGVVWGLWHLPVDFFYYSIDSGLQMAAAQQITCITLGIFFAYAYMKTDNIWVPVVLHYLNNNLIPVFSANYSADVLENQVVAWKDLPLALVVNMLFFGIFLLAKPFRKTSGY